MPEIEITLAPQVPLGDGMTVWRALPRRQRRTVGSWCFADLFGPVDLDDGAKMSVDPHPHIGLQTVSWLLEGEVLHRDSLGSEQRIRPGQLNLMTAGRGIAHSERTLPGAAGRLQGAQLWIALPGAQQQVDPAFAHHHDLPVVGVGGFEVTVMIGEIAGQVSPARTYSELVGAELRAQGAVDGSLALRRSFEHAILVLQGLLEVGDTTVEPGAMGYLAEGRDSVELRASAGTIALVLGGRRYEDELHMWWNFVGASRDMISEARIDWEAGRRFGDVVGDPATRVPAPSLPWTKP